MNVSTYSDTTFASGESLLSLRLPPEIARSFCRHPSFREGWEACSRADWLVYVAASTVTARGTALHTRVVRATSACARHSLLGTRGDTDRPRTALDIVDRWCEGRVPLSAVEDAAAIARKAVDAEWTAGSLATLYTVDTVCLRLGEWLALDVRDAASRAIRSAAAAHRGIFSAGLKTLIPIVRAVLPPPFL